MKKIVTAALILAAAASCSKEQSDYGTGGSGDTGSSVVQFTSAAIETKVSSDGTKWSPTESIGITMYDIDTDNANAESLAAASSNVHYISTNDDEQPTANFEIAADATALLYPNTGSVKFYAYYPYQDTSDGLTYSADVSDQSKDIDFMIASSEVVTREVLNNQLNFSHQLSKLTLKISGRDNVTDLSGLEVSVVGLHTTSTHNIKSGSGYALGNNDKTIEFIVTDDDTDEATATAIILPEELARDVTISFVCGSRSFSTDIAALSRFEVGKNHTYTVALGNDMPDFLGSSILSGWDKEAEDDLYSGDTYDEVIDFSSDSELLSYLVGVTDLDANDDGAITYIEAAAYDGALDISALSITAFDQIEYFINISGLTVSSTQETAGLNQAWLYSFTFNGSVTLTVI